MDEFDVKEALEGFLLDFESTFSRSREFLLFF